MKDTQSVEWTRPDSEPGFIECVGKPPMEIQQVTERSPSIEAFYGAMSAFDSSGTRFVSISKPFDIFSERIIGSAYVQRYNGSYFGNHIKLPITDTLLPSSLYASYIVISEDGSTIVTNAADHDNGDVGLGAIFIHQEINEQWVHVRTIVSAEVDTENGQFGFQMSISGDGKRILVSAPSMGNGGSNRGKAFVLDTVDNWTTFTSTLIIPTPTVDEGRFGLNCRITPNGNLLIIGEAMPDLSGVVSVFEMRLGVWTQLARLVSSNQEANVLFGSSVINLTRFERYAGDSLTSNNDGTQILIGEAGANSRMGLVYHFTRNGDQWDEVQVIDIPPDVVGSTTVFFGYSVSMNRSGSRIVIGAQGANSPGLFNVGRIAFYERCSGIFELIASVPAVSQQSGEFSGFSVSISPDGRFMASGATDYDETFFNQGRILLYNADYQFTAPPVVPKPPPIKTITYSDLVIAAGPDAYYQQNEPVGRNFSDSIGSQNGVVQGSGLEEFGSDPLKFNDPKTSIKYPLNTTGRIILPAGSNLHNNGDIAIETLIKVDSTVLDTLRPIVHKGTSNNDVETDWQLIVVFNDRLRFQSSTFPSFILETNPATIALDTAHYIVANLSAAGDISLYINGTLAASSGGFPRVATLGDIYISSEPFVGDYLMGWQSDTAFYGRLLTDAEILQRASKALNP